MSYDPFRPSHEPARSIYDAFQAQANRRKQYAGTEWIEAERKVVFEAAKAAAKKHGLVEPTLKMVERAEIYASGSADYGSKWAYTLLSIMEREAMEKPA